MRFKTGYVLSFFIYILSCLDWYFIGYKIGRKSVPKGYNILLRENRLNNCYYGFYS